MNNQTYGQARYGQVATCPNHARATCPNHATFLKKIIYLIMAIPYGQVATCPNHARDLPQPCDLPQK
jgi:hypothetical protein